MTHNKYLYVIGGYVDNNKEKYLKDVWRTNSVQIGASWQKIGNEIPFSNDVIKGLKCFTYNDNLYVMNNSSKKYNFSNGLYTLDILKLKPKSILAGMSRSNSFDDLITYVDSSINWVPISTNFVVPFP